VLEGFFCIALYSLVREGVTIYFAEIARDGSRPLNELLARGSHVLTEYIAVLRLGPHCPAVFTQGHKSTIAIGDSIEYRPLVAASAPLE
jgi:hypothetical protein